MFEEENKSKTVKSRQVSQIIENPSNAALESLDKHCKEFMALLQPGTDRETKKLREVTAELLDSLMQASTIEYNLEIKQAELITKEAELTKLRETYNSLKNKLLDNERLNKTLTEQAHALQEQYNRAIRNAQVEKAKNNELAAKISILESGITELNKTKEGNESGVNIKLKQTITTIMKQNLDLKRQLSQLKKERETLIHKVNKQDNKINRLANKINEIKTKKLSVMSENDQVNVMQSLAQTNVKGKVNRRSAEPRSLFYRIKDLPTWMKDRFEDIIENGPQSFLANLNQMSEQDKALMTQQMSVQLNSLNDFVIKAQKLVSGLFTLFNVGEMNELLVRIQDVAKDLIPCKYAFLWTIDFTNSEIYTLHDIFNNGEMVQVRIPSDKGLHGVSIRNGIFISSKNVKEEVDYDSTASEMLNIDISNQIIVPIRGTEGRFVAVLDIINNINGSFNDDDEFLAEQLAYFLGNWIVRLNGTKTIVQHYKLRENLIKAFNALAASPDRKAFNTNIEEWSKQVFQSQNGRFVPIEGDNFLIISNEGETVLLPDTTGICGEVAQSQTPLLLEKPENDPRYDKRVDISSNLFVYYVPVLDNTNGFQISVGVLQIVLKDVQRVKGDRFKIDADTEELANQFAQFIKVVHDIITEYENLHDPQLQMQRQFTREKTQFKAMEKFQKQIESKFLKNISENIEKKEQNKEELGFSTNDWLMDLLFNNEHELAPIEEEKINKNKIKAKQ